MATDSDKTVNATPPSHVPSYGSTNPPGITQVKLLPLYDGTSPSAGLLSAAM